MARMAMNGDEWQDREKRNTRFSIGAVRPLVRQPPSLVFPSSVTSSRRFKPSVARPDACLLRTRSLLRGHCVRLCRSPSHEGVGRGSKQHASGCRSRLSGRGVRLDVWGRTVKQFLTLALIILLAVLALA